MSTKLVEDCLRIGSAVKTLVAGQVRMQELIYLELPNRVGGFIRALIVEHDHAPLTIQGQSLIKVSMYLGSPSEADPVRFTDVARGEHLVEEQTRRGRL